MESGGFLAAGAAMLLAAMPGAALADATLTLTMGGEGFQGPPKFAVTFDGKPVGEGTVDAAIDTAKDGRFADAADKSKYGQTFDFKIPDDVFKADGIVAIQLTNPAQGASGSKDARELFVQSVAVNGKELPAESLSMRSDAGVEPTAMLGSYLVVSQQAVEGIALPSGGWPSAAATSAATTGGSGAPASGGAPGDATNAPHVANAATSSSATVPAASVMTAADDVSADEAGNPDPEGNQPSCGISRRFDVTGFNENSNDLTPRVRSALDVVIKTLGTQKCVVHLTGYSSIEGDYAHNALFSIERSQNALHYLAVQGVKFRKYSANGVGETTQFGPDPEANRRVVVVVTP